MKNMNLSSTSGSRLPIFFSIDSKVFVAAIRSYPMWEVRSFNYLWYTIQFNHFSHVRQCSHIRKMSCAEFYLISREKNMLEFMKNGTQWKVLSALFYGCSSISIMIINKSVLTSYHFPSFQALSIGGTRPEKNIFKS